MIVLLGAKEPVVEQLFNVQTLKVERKKIAVSQKNYGFIKADEKSRYLVAPRFGGYIIDLYADETYKYVTKGTPLAKVYSPEVYQAKDEYLNSYRYDKSSSNKGMLQSARLKLQLLGLSEGEIAAVVKSGQKRAYTMIYAPADGYIFKKRVEKGGAFTAKQTLFEIVSLKKVWLELQVTQQDAAFFKDAERFEATTRMYPERFKAFDPVIYPALDPKNATVFVRLTVPNEDKKLFPGLYANLESFKKERYALTIPQSAVIRKAGNYYAFTAGEYEGEYQPVQIRVKAVDEKIYEVIEGVSEHDVIVSNALFMMDSDAQINGLYE